ncbi:MAG TPA: DegT/DnrJ/EryC1/StrS family aminotransferase [Chryseolinea sp.]
MTEALKRVFEKNWYILGEELKTFESEYARFTNVRHCIGVGNGYDALSIALKACNLAPGDEVVVPAHTYVATWLAVSRCGGVIVPVEPDPSSLLIDAEKVEEHITPKTKIILPVHLYGHPCDMTKLEQIGSRHSIKIIEDNAQAHGAKWKEKMTGSFGAVNATSFYPTKNLGALGDGGAVTTDSDTIAEFVRQYRNYGFERKNYCEVEGINSRLDEMQASVLSIKLKYLDHWNLERRKLANHYIDRLRNVGDIKLIVPPREALPVYHLFVIRSKKRDKLRAYLDSCQIETTVHYPLPPHLQKPYASLNLKRGSLTLTEEIANTCLSLPLWPGMTTHQVDRVCDCITTFFSR